MIESKSSVNEYGSRNFAAADILFMQRALQLARLGDGNVSPNPMVGCVIVAHNKIIGEGWHRKFGGPHAEVNAVNSITSSNEHLLSEATVYVTLEPCSHYGKTPPCALLLVEKKVKRVVVATLDPFIEVAGRGVKILRDNGIAVDVGLLQQEARALNKKFFTAHILKRPYILLKWAQSADGFLAKLENNTPIPTKFSTPLSLTFVHQLRAQYDAILVGNNTIRIDTPSLTTRFWPGTNPKRVAFNSDNADFISLNPSLSLQENISNLYTSHSITSLIVEGGRFTLQQFINLNLFDEIRIETSPMLCHKGIPAPQIPDTGLVLRKHTTIGNNLILWYSNTFVKSIY